MDKFESLKISNLPKLPGVYFFKDKTGTVLYVGKAKNLKNRVSSYKESAILSSSETIDHIVTKNEIEALLLEAKLIRSYQPKFNILLKSGQPYLYLLFSQNRLPTLKIVRNKKLKGVYFGPFLEKNSARRVYNFLIKTFKLKICNKKIENGCLYYHLEKCAGSCKKDFDEKSYLERLDLAKKALTKGHKKFLIYLKDKISESNKKLNFEKSKELHSYHQAFEKIFASIQTHFSSKEKDFSHKHIWVFDNKSGTLFLFDEINNVTKKKEIFHTINNFEASAFEANHLDYFKSYYHQHDCPQIIITNFKLLDSSLFENFLQKWHKKSYPVKIFENPVKNHFKNLLELAMVHAEQELKKIKTLGSELKNLLKLTIDPITIDCFDISHKQGQNMVGSCVRFKNGKPDKNNFRKFKIKTVENQDDYAALREIVKRRYKDLTDLPDLILIDGGKGQLNAVKGLFEQIDFVALAKKEETIFTANLPNGKKLNLKNPADQTLIALRDYAHHFAISYHKKLSAGNKF